jgi:hypothetical protein
MKPERAANPDRPKPPIGKSETSGAAISPSPGPGLRFEVAAVARHGKAEHRLMLSSRNSLQAAAQDFLKIGAGVKHECDLGPQQLVDIDVVRQNAPGFTFLGGGGGGADADRTLVAASESRESVIIGAKSTAQLDDNLATTDIEQSADELSALEKASAPVREYPQWMLDRQRRRPATLEAYP